MTANAILLLTAICLQIPSLTVSPTCVLQVVDIDTGDLEMVSLPRSILSGDVERWADLLGLSDAQMVLIDAYFAEFTSSDQARRLDQIPKLVSTHRAIQHEREEAIAAGRDDAHTRFAGRMIELSEARRELLRDLHRHEDAFLAEVRQLLTDEQLAHWPRVVHATARRRLNCLPTAMPGVTVDLIELLRGLECPEAAPDWQRTLVEYEVAFVTALQSRYEARLETTSRILLLRAQQASRTEQDADVAKELAKLDDALYRDDRRVRSVNLRFVVEIANLLEQSARETFESRFNKVVYRLIHPDFWDVSDIYAAAIELPDCSDSQRESLGGLEEQYHREHEVVSRKARLAWDEWRVDRLEDPTESAAIRADAHERFEQWMARRDELNRRQIELIENVLSAEQAERCGQLQEFRRRWEANHRVSPEERRRIQQQIRERIRSKQNAPTR